jgi:hypothetical protein
MAMENVTATGESSGASQPAAPPRADLPELLRFLEGERRRSQRASFFAALFGVTIGALATAAWWTRNAPPADAGANTAVEQRLHGLESSSGALAAQMRALVSRPQNGDGGGDSAATAPKSEVGDASIAGRPSTQSFDDNEHGRHAGDDALARALAHASQVPVVVNDAAKSATPAAADVKIAAPPEGDSKASAPPEGQADPKAEAKKSEAAAAAALEAFNALLVDCGLEQWHLMSAELSSEDHALHKIVMVHRTPIGTANGSLTADRLVLERDAGTGVAAFVLTGAHQTESGVEQAFPNGTTRLEIPGVLPLDLVPSGLSALFGSAQNGAIGTTSRLDFNDPLQVTRAINRVLALEKGVSMRLRSCDRFAEDRLEKAVIDLTFDERGDPQQTVFADKAWFELDAKRDYVELCCDGGDMVVGGTRRPLFRGHLRWPLHSVTPPQWRGMPGLKLVSGS